MKAEENKTFQKDIDDIYGDFIRVQKLFSVIMGSIDTRGTATPDELDAMDAVADYFNRVMEAFDAVMNPTVLPRQEVPA